MLSYMMRNEYKKRSLIYLSTSFNNTISIMVVNPLLSELSYKLQNSRNKDDCNHFFLLQLLCKIYHNMYSEADSVFLY